MPTEVATFDPMKPIDISFLQDLMESRGTGVITFRTLSGHWFCSLQIVNGYDTDDAADQEYLGVTIGQGGLNLSTLLNSEQLASYSSWAELAEMFLVDPWSVYNVSGDLALIDRLSATVDIKTNRINPEPFLEINQRPFEGSESDETWYSSSVLTLNSLVQGFESFLLEVENDTVPPKQAYAAIEMAAVFQNGFKAGRLLSEIRKLTHLNTHYIRGMQAKRWDDARGQKGGSSASERKMIRIRSLMESLQAVRDSNPLWQLSKFEELVGVAGKLAKKAEQQAWKGVSPFKGMEYVEDAAHGGEFSIIIQSIKEGLA